jgi:hypothetical protein
MFHDDDRLEAYTAYQRIRLLCWRRDEREDVETLAVTKQKIMWF